MREFIDPRGNTIRGYDESEIARLETALIGMLGMEFDPLEHLARTAQPPPTPAALLLECVWRLASMEDRQIQLARDIVTMIEAKNMCRLESEWLHFSACKNWVNQDFEAAHGAWRRLLAIAPRDILAVFGIHMLEFNMGWSSRMKETMRLVSGAWHPGVALFGYFKGIEAFVLTENGDYDNAWTAAARALEVNPRDIYALHAACHIYYETGRFQHAIEWMNERRNDWAGNRGMRIHVWWHYALFYFYMLNVDKVLSIFHEKIRDKNDPDGYEDLDAVSLLWRLSLIGVDVTDLWRDVAQYWMPSIDQSRYWFNDVHAMMAMVSSNHDVLIHRILRHVTTNYRKVPRVAAVTRTVCQALIDFGRHDYQSAYETILNVLGSVYDIGGSNAQRDLLEMTAIEAALRCGHKNQARRLIRRGRSFRHSSPLRDLYLERASASGHEVVQDAAVT